MRTCPALLFGGITLVDLGRSGRQVLVLLPPSARCFCELRFLYHESAGEQI